MVKSLDDFAHDVPATPLTTSRDQFAERAYSLLTSSAAQSAFRIERRAGRRSARSTGGRRSASRACWPGGWSRRASRSSRSTIAAPARSAGTRTPRTSPRSRTRWRRRSTRGSPRCVEDLSERGLLDNTLVVMMGEFGRTPKINPNAGRDHHGRANSVLLFGAGIPGGLVLGRTDAHGDSPVERPVTPADLASVLYHKLGIDPDTEVRSPRRPADPPRRGRQPPARAGLTRSRSASRTMLASRVVAP